MFEPIRMMVLLHDLCLIAPFLPEEGICSSRQSRLCLAVLVLAAFLALAPVAFSESSFQAQSRVSAPVSQESPIPAAPQPVALRKRSSRLPRRSSGDSLMAHQRYQAAIAAYSKAPRTAVLWNKMGIAYQLMLNSAEAEHCYEASLKPRPQKSARHEQSGHHL